MTPNSFAVLLMVCAPLGAFLLSRLHDWEQRMGRARTLASQLFYLFVFGIFSLFYLDGAMDGDRSRLARLECRFN